jgi:hypothetical protein
LRARTRQFCRTSLIAIGARIRTNRNLALFRFHSTEHDPSRVEFLSVRLVRRSTEYINHATHMQIAEAGGPNDLHVLLDEECPRNSTCPEADVVHDLI